MNDIVKRLIDRDTSRRPGENYADVCHRRQKDRDDAADAITRLEAECFSQGEEIARLRVENIQMKFALGYPMPADLERYIIPANPFRCGTCDARSINSLTADNERLRAALQTIADMTDYGTETATWRMTSAIHNANVIARAALTEKTDD